MKILIPTNLSKSSQSATHFALSYFGHRAAYCLLNSFPLVYRSGFYDSFNKYSPQHDGIPLEKLKRERKQLLEKYGDQIITLKALYGDPVKDIFQTAEEEKIDLIVLGYGSFLKWNDGFSYRDQHALHDLPYPILLVPENYTHSNSKSIYYVTDFSNAIISESMLLIRYIARFSKATIKLYCFENNDVDNGLDKWTIDKHLDGIDHTFEIIQSVEGGLNKFVEELRKEDHSLVIFDFQQSDNPMFNTIERHVSEQSFVKPLLLMPKNFEENCLQGV
ncbi:MAG: hypothetical protein ACI837_000506 [Crocinitomicaceae bacterium]|jgi:hypothetical protein